MTDWKSSPCFWMIEFNRFAIMIVSGRERCVTTHVPATCTVDCSFSVSAATYVHFIRTRTLGMPAIPAGACVSKFIAHTPSKLMRQSLALPMPMCKTMNQSSTIAPTWDPGPNRTCKGSGFESDGSCFHEIVHSAHGVDELGLPFDTVHVRESELATRYSELKKIVWIFATALLIGSGGVHATTLINSKLSFKNMSFNLFLPEPLPYCCTQ